MILGKAWADAIISYLDVYPIEWVTKDGFIDAKVVQSWVLFGDPSLKIGGYT